MLFLLKLFDLTLEMFFACQLCRRRSSQLLTKRLQLRYSLNSFLSFTTGIILELTNSLFSLVFQVLFFRNLAPYL